MASQPTFCHYLFGRCGLREFIFIISYNVGKMNVHRHVVIHRSSVR